MKRILELTLWLGLAAGVAAQVPDFVNLPVQCRAPQIDKGYDRADPYAVAFAVRTISFSGREWWVKSSTGRVGPGPNYFSDSADNVWVDDLERLHLRLTKAKARWYCAEIVSVDPLGHGSYIWELDSPVDGFDRNVVLGLFTWSDTSGYANGEIDIEFARWASRSLYPNAQYVVQPFDLPGHMVRFSLPPGFPQTTHTFLWAPDGVSFQSLGGLWSDGLADTLIYEWTFPSAWPPPTGTENARMNLWLYQGAKPSNGLEVEVIIRSFTFVPQPNP
jgi:hypothetical protein